MIRLYQFKTAWGLPNLSPFCMKLEVFLRICNLDYQVVIADSPKIIAKSPKGKLPFIEDKGKFIGDSSFIIEYLKREYSLNPDHGLSNSELAVAHSFRRMFEENLYWAVLYSRWFMASNWEKTREAFFGDIPFPFNKIVSLIARRSSYKQLYGHGMGRHSEDEIFRIAIDDLRAITDFLADKEFFMGDKPSSVDATAYAFLANIVDVPVESPVKAYAKSYDNITNYCIRMKERFF